MNLHDLLRHASPDVLDLNADALKRPARQSAVHSEHTEQAALFAWAAANEHCHPELRWLFAIPNGGHRHIAVAAKLKSEGVKAGVPDILLPVARGGYHGLFIEMKVGDNKPTPLQRVWHEALRRQGYRVEVCYGAAAAVRVLTAYLCT